MASASSAGRAPAGREDSSIAPRRRTRRARMRPDSSALSVLVASSGAPAARASSGPMGTAARIRACSSPLARSMPATASHSWPSRAEPAGRSAPTPPAST